MNNNGSNNEFRNNIIISQLKYCWEKYITAMKANPQTKTPFILSRLNIMPETWNFITAMHMYRFYYYSVHISHQASPFSFLSSFFFFTRSCYAFYMLYWLDCAGFFFIEIRRKKEAKKLCFVVGCWWRWWRCHQL